MILSRKFCVYLHFTPLFTSCCKHELCKQKSKFSYFLSFFVPCCMLSYSNFPISSSMIAIQLGRAILNTCYSDYRHWTYSHYRHNVIVTGLSLESRAASTNQIARSVIVVSKFILNINSAVK